ncbi:hypothetical protein Poli38472_012185 [Pythium oligandrum]|uniref:Uncharacterized protein n=1 Tax=Pythium oligandrum TaxID=41045 RepID=A0A8K1CPW8_PYTOL|nr:hypothetical protein Poli38472_012185 [Pythium oligandrum]|eukprot:TMW67069.1 hypothetical protein Poli38472_012185 [Pythium oligandrum]
MPTTDGKAAATRDAAIAGAVAGGASRLVAAPLDLIKIRFQVQQAPISSHPGAKYVGFLQSIRSIHAEEGLRGFWRGNLAATGLWISYSAVQFGAYGGLKTLWPPDIANQHSTLVSSVNGATAGVLATVVTYPLDLFRTIFASQGVPKQFPTLQSLASHTLETRGVVGFYNGLGPTLCQIAPYMGLSFGIYAALNDLTASSGVHWVLSYVGTGATAGLVSKLMVYPLDTVKKRMQIRQLQRNPSYGVMTPYSSSWACFLDIVRREGMRGLYKGTVPSLLKSVVTHSSTFASYEVALVVLQRLRQDEDDDDEMDKL